MPLNKIDVSLSRGLVRAEARQLTRSIEQHSGEVLKTFYGGVGPRFEKGGRLSADQLRALAASFDSRAREAFSPLWSDMSFTPPTPGRPNSASYDMLHYWINPVEVEGSPNRLMKVAAFSSWGDRKNVSICAHDTLVSFYEHAAHRLLQRFPGNLDAAIRQIGQRLVEALILPSLAVFESERELANRQMHIPFMDGLLLGEFIARPFNAAVGDYRRFCRAGCQEGTMGFPVAAEYVVKTYIGPREISDQQKRSAHQVETWLTAHAMEADVIRRFASYKQGSLWDCGQMALEAVKDLHADFWRMWEDVSGDVGKSRSEAAAKEA